MRKVVVGTISRRTYGINFPGKNQRTLPIKRKQCKEVVDIKVTRNSQAFSNAGNGCPYYPEVIIPLAQ